MSNATQQQTSSAFKYGTIVRGEEDLVIFSSMNMREDKPCYLVHKGDEWYEIIYNLDQLERHHKIAAIGLNGVVYKPS